MMFSMYLLEEVFENDADRSIATTCSGSRTGIRGQTGRCDIAEFCDHLFEPFEKPTGRTLPNGKAEINFDEKPDKDAIRSQWSRRVLDIGQTDLFKMAQGIDIIRVPNPAPDRPPADYVHGIKAENALAGTTGTDAYYDLMRNLGPVYARAQQRLNDIVQSDDNLPPAQRVLGASQRRRLEKWGLEAKRGTKAVHELRLKDTARYQLLDDGLKKTFGHPIEATYRVYDNDVLKTMYGDGFAASLERDTNRWREPSQALTVNRYRNQFSSEAAANAKYQDALTAYFADEKGKDHKKAIDAIDATRQVAEAVPLCTP